MSILVQQCQDKLWHYSQIHGEYINDLTPEQAYAHARALRDSVKDQEPDLDNCQVIAHAVQFESIGDCLAEIARFDPVNGYV